jgi:hypothetical protein
MTLCLGLLLALSPWWATVLQEPVTAPGPSAEGWRFLTTDSRSKDYYYLRGSHPYYTEVWFKTIGEVTKETEVLLDRFNCDSGARRLIQISSFRGDLLVNSHVYSESEWQYSYPKTIGAAQLRAACGERKREWTYVGESDDEDSYFLKLDSLTRKGKLVRVWSQTLKGEVGKSVILYEFDCVEEKLHTLQDTTYVGSQIETSTRPDAWAYVVPNSVGEMLAKAACQVKPASPKRKGTLQ